MATIGTGNVQVMVYELLGAISWSNAPMIDYVNIKL
jgi:hypothetical protein